MFRKGKIILFSVLFIVLLVAVPVSFATDNNTNNISANVNSNDIPTVTADDLINDRSPDYTINNVSEMSPVNNFSNHSVCDYYVNQDENGSYVLSDNNSNYYPLSHYTQGNSSEIGEILKNNNVSFPVTVSLPDGTYVKIMNNNVSYKDDSNITEINITNNTSVINLPNITTVKDWTITENLEKAYEEMDRLNGTAYTMGNISANATINLFLTRLSDNKTKMYTVTTDSEGHYYLPINLYQGTYTVKTYFGDSYLSNGSYYTESNIIINAPKILPMGCSALTHNLRKTYGDNGNLIGVTATELGLLKPNVTVQLKLTRDNDGASKTYTVTSDVTGHYSLPITLAVGNYTVETIQGNHTQMTTKIIVDPF